MARSEKRTLEIRAALKDLITAPLGGMQGKIVTWSRRVIGSFKNVLSPILNLKTAIVGLGVSVLSLSTVKAFGEQADELLKLARSTGDTVENLSELQAAFQLAGVEGESFRSLLRALETQARKAQDEQKLADAFAAIGIALRDLKTLGPSELFERMAAGLETYGTAQQKTAALGRVLPKQFLDSLPLLEGGLRSFQTAIREARDSGATVTEQQAKISERLNDSLTKIQIAIGGVSRALIEQFGPDAIALFERLAKGITENRQGVVNFAEAVGRFLVGAFNLATSAAIGLVDVIETLSPISLVDDSQVSELRIQIALIEDMKRALERAKETGSEVRNFATAKVDGVRQVRFAKDVLPLLEREGAIRDRLANLEEAIQIGIAGAMRKARDRLSNEISSVAATIREPATGGSVVSRGGQVWTDIQETTANVQSVFRPTKDTGTGALVDDLDEASDATERLGKKAAKAGMEVTEAFHGDFFAGFSAGANKALVEITNFQAAGENAAQTLLLNGFNGLSDAFADIILGTKSAKEAFRDFARAMLSDIARITTRLLIMNAIQGIGGGAGGNLFGFANGGVMQGTMGPVRAFASGGVTNGPTVALFGEGKKREAFVPLPDNRTIPVTINGGRGMGGGDVHVHFNVDAVDSRSVQRLFAEHGETIAAVVAEKAGGASVRFRHQMAKAAR